MKKTVEGTFENKIIIKNSKFIAIITFVDNETKAKETLDKIRKEYLDASHVCFAYIIDNIKRASDDKEPSKTAGMPILNVLEKEELNYVLCIVIRYFGGIKLGANGLVRAYTMATSEVLKKAKLCFLEDGFHIVLATNYDCQKEVDFILSDKIITKEYGEKVLYHFNTTEKFFKENENKLTKLGTIKEIEKCKIKIGLD